MTWLWCGECRGGFAGFAVCGGFWSIAQRSFPHPVRDGIDRRIILVGRLGDADLVCAGVAVGDLYSCIGRGDDGDGQYIVIRALSDLLRDGGGDCHAGECRCKAMI